MAFTLTVEEQAKLDALARKDERARREALMRDAARPPRPVVKDNFGWDEPNFRPLPGSRFDY